MKEMEIEAIKHEVAQEVFDNTGYDWRDMLDNTADIDREIAYRVRNMITADAEASVRRSYTEYFTEALEAVYYSDLSSQGREYGNEPTHLKLTGKAFDIYSVTDPLTITEHQAGNIYRYDLDGVIVAEGLTEEELIETILSLDE